MEQSIKPGSLVAHRFRRFKWRFYGGFMSWYLSEIRVKLSTEGRRFVVQKMIMIPEERYYKMLESYDKVIQELEKLKKALEEAGTSNKG